MIFVFGMPENPYIDRAYMVFLKKSIFFLDYNVRVPENINFRMSEFRLGTMLSVPHKTQLYASQPRVGGNAGSTAKAVLSIGQIQLWCSGVVPRATRNKR